jgi:hypothetical protein
MEICFECKDKVIKFYHFKRKVHEARKLHKISKSNRKKSGKKEKRSKIVQNIYQIIENYTEKCEVKVSKIQIDEQGSKLIIESREDGFNNAEKMLQDQVAVADMDDEPAIDPKKIKEEPEMIFSESLKFRQGDSNSIDDQSINNDSDDSQSFQDFLEPSTSHDTFQPKRKRTSEILHPALNSSNQAENAIYDVEAAKEMQRVKSSKSFQNYATYFEVMEVYPKGDRKHARFKAKCKICGHEEKQCIGAGYSNLRRHLNKKHDGMRLIKEDKSWWHHFNRINNSA